MSPRPHTASVLRQPTLAAQPRVPGRRDPSDEKRPERGELDREAPARASAPASSAASDALALDAEIERRAAELAKAHVLEVRETIAAQARDEGYAQGLKQGREAAQEEWSALAVRAQTLLDAVRTASAQEAQVSAELALHLTFSALRKLLGAAFASRAGVEAAIVEALAQTDAQSVVTLRVAPADAAFIGGVEPGSGLFGVLASGISIEADDRMEAGGCMIETVRGTLDARIETQLESLLQVLKEAYDARRAEALAIAQESSP